MSVQQRPRARLSFNPAVAQFSEKDGLHGSHNVHVCSALQQIRVQAAGMFDAVAQGIGGCFAQHGLVCIHEVADGFISLGMHGNLISILVA